MSVEITTDPPEVRDSSGTEVADTVAAAEAVLSRRFGAKVRLADPEDLGGSDRSTVIRVRVAVTPFSLPRTLVVKRYHKSASGGRADVFVHEAVSYQLFTALAPEERISPELVAHDGAQRLMVLEDLGRAPTLADKLLSDDARAAERALLAWARSLGRLHASTAGREADFDALMRRLGAQSWRDPLAPDARAALADLPALLERVLGVRTSPAAVDQARGTARLLGGTRHRAFSPSDACPDNNVITSRGVRFLDFEGGCVRDVALDAAFLRVPFPSCWCAYGLPAGMTEAMLAVWRVEVGAVWPDLDDDAVLLPTLLDAQLLWVWLSTWTALPRLDSSDAAIDQRVLAPRRSTALTARWVRLRADAAALSRQALVDHADAVVEALVTRFGSESLPLYPAFR